MRRLLLAAAALCGLAAGPAPAAEPPYLDDRSGPEALIRSLYNAINRKEYARAYGYFSTPPAETWEAFAEGFSQTESVALTTGQPSLDAAAGGIYYHLPIALLARHSDGSEAVFAGCYTLRLANPRVQGAPFEPLHIEEGRLAPADGPPQEALPARCGEGQVQDAEALLAEKAKARFAALYGDSCLAGPDVPEESERHTIAFNHPHEDPQTPPHEVHLFRFFCDAAAYNTMHVYFLADEFGKLLPLRFAVPELAIRYENGDAEGRVEELRIVGYTAEDVLLNSRFDPQTLEITTLAKWRGLGDAFSAGVWLFRAGTFTLVKYEVDASYDGEINPELLLDYHSGP